MCMSVCLMIAPVQSSACVSYQDLCPDLDGLLQARHAQVYASFNKSKAGRAVQATGLNMRLLFHTFAEQHCFLLILFFPYTFV